MNRNIFKHFKFKAFFITLSSFITLFLIAQDASAQNLGDMAASITGTFDQVGKMITAGSYIAGLGFSIGAIMKFKAHKDNPTQIPIGTPVALVFIAAALLFLPSILAITGQTMFGSEGGTTAGPSGTVITK